ncbi:LuxR family transcriptional regulator [Roseicyclus sp. F158]|uniref:LuxR family transcriptional regulator n=1 Tax=Tropicimonas omnivorans TaxID=3075590 RepID=A0ABU3DF63_9RHOB|nr:LuxR family transcriptional regulator [Roseicyclus sp. F158]MDT0681762.1 LuxR family transcriptional regulator [Roseicyclus sp. F158]
MTMGRSIEGLCKMIRSAETVEDLQKATEAVSRHYAVDHFVYHWVNNAGERFGAGTYTAEWVDHYVEQGYLRVDPVILGSLQRADPTNWRDLDWSSKSAKQFRADAIEHGVGNQGLSIPVRGPTGQLAVLTISHNCDDVVWNAFCEENTHDLLILAHEFNLKALEFETVANPAPSLSSEERDAIACLARGMDMTQAAEELGVSERAIRVRTEGARHKLGALNTTHAVARAISYGLIVV